MLQTRRSFLQNTLTATAGFYIGSKFASTEEHPAFPPGTYFDIHTHITQPWGQKEALTVEELLRWMDKNEVAQSAVLPLVSPESWYNPISTGYVLKETHPHRDRLIPFCSIDPRTINLGGTKGYLDLLKRYQDAGAKGFGEHKPGVAIDDPRNLELFNAAAEVGLPVLFHLDNSRNFDKPGLPGLENLLKQIPNGVFIAHAQGWWASISGETTQADLQQYPKGEVKPGGAIDRLMDTYPNIYGDLSAGSGLNAMTRDPEFGREFVIRRADRLLWGTDFLAPGQQTGQLSFYLNLDLPEDVQANVFRENARRLLGLA
jgi:predicted TIM-barrel fold metal-dependent hydrolase